MRILFTLCLLSTMSCAGQQTSVDDAIKALDKVIATADEVHESTVTVCLQAQSAAAQFLEVEKAAEAVDRIRGYCDEAHRAADVMRQTVEALDRVMGRDAGDAG